MTILGDEGAKPCPMYFQLRYITTDFDFGDKQISVSAPEKKMDVLLRKRIPEDAPVPALEAGDGFVSVTCEREMTERIRSEAVASGRLSVKKGAVKCLMNEMHNHLLRTMRLIRWRTNFHGRPDPIRCTVETGFRWSLDGIEWKPVADNISMKLQLHVPPAWTSEAAQFLGAEASGELDEPLGHELLMEARVGHINPYLVDTDDILVRSRRSPLSDVPRIVFGSMANDHGHLLLDDNERADLVAREPGAAKYIRRIYGSDEFLYNIPRWCLWLVDAQPQDLRQLPLVIQRVDAVAAYRRRSKRPATRKLAEVPTLFGERRQPSTEYLIIPKTSSEVRKYVPMGFMPPEIIASDLCLMVPGATRYHLGVVSSEMHMAWLRQIGGRLEGRYRYSNNIVYNNFPWPQTCTAAQQQRVAERAENILIVRATYHDATLADLYDRNTMPRDLLDAHRDLDAAVDVCYRATPFTNELERLVFLLNLYRRLSQPLLPTERAPRGRRRN